MPLQFRRGHSDDLPLPSDAAVGEPLFTTNDGKLHIKKADGTFAEIGDGSDIDLSGLATGSLVQVNATQDGFDAATQIPSAVTFVTTSGSGFSNAVNTRLLAELPVNGGALNVAQESTLQSFSSTLSTVQSGLAALQYLSTYFTDAALPATPTTTGFLKYDAAASPPGWSLVTSTATAPDEINGGSASSFGA